jgi:hypothetical protein
MVTIPAPNAREPLMQVPTFQKFPDDMEIAGQKNLSLREKIVIAFFKLVKMLI